MHFKSFLLTGICLISISHFLLAQVAPFERQENIPVQKEEVLLKHAWVGGLNNPQFSGIDFNDDGVEDLFVFDKAGNHILTFLNNGTPNQVDYTFAPQYASYFPEGLHDWVVLVDYTQDGLPDIFTFNITSPSIHKATRNIDGSISYTLVAERLLYQGLSGVINILGSSIDIPGFADINGDGDIDVLAFDFGGNYVEYFENQSQELTSTPDDTIWFERITKCWGHFRENNDDNGITLDNCGEFIASDAPSSQIANQAVHSGSSMLIWDLDNDADKDIILGDVSFPNLVKITNAGTPMEATTFLYDANFPMYDTPVNLPIFPAAFAIDVNNDGLKDMLVAPSERNSISTQQVWHYQNIGNEEEVLLAHQQTDFLLGDMMDAGVRSYPLWVDYNRDGLLDILVGNYGYYNFETELYEAAFQLYENTGTTTNPRFNWITDDYQNLKSNGHVGLCPSLVDFDNDGDLDLIAGTEIGNILYFENIAPTDAPIQWTNSPDTLIALPFENALTPCVYDVDGDGQLDLVVGEKSGKLNYVRNNSTTSSTLSFELIDNFWGGVDVKELGTPFGYSAPYIYDFTNTDGTTQAYLFVQADNGKIHVFTDLDQSTFTLVSNNFSNINEGGRGGLALADINGDGAAEMLVGNYRGGLSFFTQQTIDVMDNVEELEAGNLNAKGVKIYPNPARDIIYWELPSSSKTNNYKGQLLDVKGRVLQEIEKHKIKGQMDISSMRTGIYFLRFFSGDRTPIAIKKILILK